MRIYKLINIVQSQHKRKKGELIMERERKQEKILVENFIEQHKKRKSIKIISEVTSYLKLHNLYFETDQMEGIPRIKMVFKNVTDPLIILQKGASGSMRTLWK